jgi:xylulose-5-phosphate/fructose-6-phosphate phosphoketolase
MFYVAGPGHGGPAIVGNTYLEGTYSEVYPDVSRDRATLKRLFKQFSFPGGISSHVAPTTPESIYEGGELSSLLSLGIKRPLTTIESGGTCGHRGRANGS